jgi:hypothetical protein
MTTQFLSENVFYFAEQGAALRLVLDLRRAFEFLQQLALALAEFGGRLHADLDIEVPFAVAV